MHEEVKQMISELVDNELGNEKTLEMLKAMRKDAVLKQQMCRYQVISQALKSESICPVKSDFSDKIRQQIQQEPTHFLPQAKPKPQGRTELPSYRIYALAASVLAAAVLGSQVFWRDPITQNQIPMLSANAVPQQLSASTYPSDSVLAKHSQPNYRFNAYLQAHNSSFYTNGEAEFHPLAQTASYGQE